MPPLRVLHLVGSPTNPFYQELSELYARGCLDALGTSSQYQFVIAHVSPGDVWRFPVSLNSFDVMAAGPITFSEAMKTLDHLEIDIALPQMFCLRGMTDYRTLLDLLLIPYIGNRALQMAMAADKAKARAIVSAAGVRIPTGELLTKGDAPTLRPPTVVKPKDSDNSDGVALVRSVDEYPAALEAAFGHSEAVLVEQYIELGREVRCGVIERDGRLLCLPLEEYFVDSSTRPIRTLNHKLKRNESNSLVLAAKQQTEAWIVPEDDPIVEAVWAAARRCHAALDCRHYSMFDFRIDPDGEPWFLEAGLYCSFSPQSVLVTMMSAKGISLDCFFESSINQALILSQ